MTDFEKAKKIYARMAEHLVPVMKSGMEWVGLFLQGSQNYDLDYEGSDIDTKVIVLPSFTDFVLNRKPVSTTHIMENNEHLDFKDIRLMFDCIKKQNVNFVEILFTRYMILNPKYEDLFQSVLDAREDIARYNNYAGVNCLVGMALEKHDPKQLHHALRMREFMTRYLAGVSYEDCLISAQHDYLMDVKRGCCTLEQARELMSKTIETMIADKKNYMDTHPPIINKHAEEVLQTATVEILKRCFLSEIGGMN